MARRPQRDAKLSKEISRIFIVAYADMGAAAATFTLGILVLHASVQLLNKIDIFDDHMSEVHDARLNVIHAAD